PSTRSATLPLRCAKSLESSVTLTRDRRAVPSAPAWACENPPDCLAQGPCLKKKRRRARNQCPGGALSQTGSLKSRSTDTVQWPCHRPIACRRSLSMPFLAALLLALLT